MVRSSPRYTVGQSFEIGGLGLHSGRETKVRVKPGNQGIAFWDGATRIEAAPENVSDTRRCTVLGTIATIEHLMSALAGAGITDAEIEVEGNELPGLDGSAKRFSAAIGEVGVVECGSIAVEGPFERVFTVHESAKVGVAKGDGHWRYHFDLTRADLGEQIAEVQLGGTVYQDEVALARTIVFEEELPHVAALGLGQGLTENDVLIIGKGGYRNEARLPLEPATHKLLDLIGDLALAGIPATLLSVVAERSGHSLNVQAAMRLRQHVEIDLKN